MAMTVLLKCVGTKKITRFQQLGSEISRCNTEASKANLERPRVRTQREIYQKTQRFNVVRSIDLRPQRR